MLCQDSEQEHASLVSQYVTSKQMLRRNMRRQEMILVNTITNLVTSIDFLLGALSNKKRRFYLAVLRIRNFRVYYCETYLVIQHGDELYLPQCSALFKTGRYSTKLWWG